MIRKSFKLSMLVLGVFAGGLLSSCTNDEEPAINPTTGNVLVKAPKMVAYSGETYFGETKTGTRGDEAMKPKAVTSDEMTAVRNAFNAIDDHYLNNRSTAVEGVTLYNGFYDFNTRWLHDGEDFYVVNIVNGTENQLANNDLKIWHEKLAYDISEDTYNNGDFTLLPYVDLFLNYESYNPQIHVGKKIEDLSLNAYSTFICATNPLYNSKANQDYNAYGNYPPFRYVTIEGLDEDEDWEYAYIGCYWQASAEYSPNSPNTEKGDNQWDRVIRVAKRKYVEPEPVEPEPETPVVGGHNHSNEVEVNLHGVEKNNDCLESHLSLHVRYAGDVEVFIPVSRQYTCEKDDMDIVMMHEANHMVHSASFTLKDSASSPYGELTVSVTVAYEEDGIRITTHGVTQDVIDWCAEKCNDGITFEIWNYYNDPEKLGDELGISYEELLDCLNRATVRFLGSELPDSYINSFGKDEDKTSFSRDCTVTLVTDQAGAYPESPTVGEHLNGSPNNLIYEKNK